MPGRQTADVWDGGRHGLVTGSGDGGWNCDHCGVSRHTRVEAPIPECPTAGRHEGLMEQVQIGGEA